MCELLIRYILEFQHSLRYVTTIAAALNANQWAKLGHVWITVCDKTILRDGAKPNSFAPCFKCSAQASSEHILDFLGVSKLDLVDRRVLVLDFLKVYSFMDIIQPC